MLAEEERRMDAGMLGLGVQQPHEQLIALTDFMSKHLPAWRDRSDRTVATGEDKLTYSLCLSLDQAAQHSTTWCHFRFMHQGPTEADGRRRMDLNVHLIQSEVVFAGREHELEEPVLRIECKRLPTPGPLSERDIREYVYSAMNTGGGIQRFKIGAHGADNEFAAMIGYVQDKDCGHWLAVVNDWVRDLSTQGIAGWSKADCLSNVLESAASRTAVHASQHSRSNSSKAIQLRHLWVVM